MGLRKGAGITNMDKNSPTVNVGCAVILHKDRILIAQRKKGDTLAGYWEFPGGKLEECESLEECLAREVREELGIEIKAVKFWRTIEHEYPAKKLALHFYFCRWISGKPEPIECAAARWIKIPELKRYKFPPADTDVIKDLIANETEYRGMF